MMYKTVYAYTTINIKRFGVRSIHDNSISFTLNIEVINQTTFSLFNMRQYSNIQQLNINLVYYDI